jgi:hypothetical protein
MIHADIFFVDKKLGRDQVAVGWLARNCCEPVAAPVDCFSDPVVTDLVIEAAAAWFRATVG